MSADTPPIKPDIEDIKKDMEKFSVAWEQLKNRCVGTSITIKEDPNDDFSPYAIGFPSGREKKWFGYDAADYRPIEKLLTVPFEKYIFIGKYEAICSFSDSTIEAAVRPWSNMPVSFLMMRMLERFGKSNDGKNYQIKVEAAYNDRTISLSLGAPSNDLSIMIHEFRRRRTEMSLLISGIQVSRHDHALRILEMLANSFFLQLDLITGYPFGLRREYNIRPSSSPQSRPKELNFEFPSRAFDEEPISLYWYARSANGMPLLQYLAFYQTIEYYFHIFSLADAKRKISNIIKDPLFRCDRDADIGRLISAMSFGSRTGMPDERSQLKAVLNHCIDAKVLREFLSSNKYMADYFASSKDGPSRCFIHTENDKTDILHETAERIYDIRCKIVHTKNSPNDSDIKLLLPYSPEVDHLSFDIELVKYVAKKVLVAASTKLEL